MFRVGRILQFRLYNEKKGKQNQQLEEREEGILELWKGSGESLQYLLWYYWRERIFVSKKGDFWGRRRGVISSVTSCDLLSYHSRASRAPRKTRQEQPQRDGNFTLRKEWLSSSHVKQTIEKKVSFFSQESPFYLLFFFLFDNQRR